MPTTSRRGFLKLAGGALAGAVTSAGAVREAMAWLPTDQLPAATNPALHLLNRISYGARPEELERVRQMGIEAYLDEQLQPDSIDDAEWDAQLKTMPILSMDRRAAYSMGPGASRVHMTMVKGMVIRAAITRRQLLERMVEFWTDHFNITTSDYRPDLMILHRDVIRRHALGRFRDLVFGVAQNPAMLYYLDQAYSEKEHPNENYARELLELHTLGVNGGYTEQDVKEVARALTGFTVHDGTETGFFFNMEMHDTGEKVVLGHRLPAGRGIEDGLHVLDIVTHHPSTARFVCTKLCRRFISDDPPASIIDSAVNVWQNSEGDIRAVMRHILLSAEFQVSVGQKLRRPLDFFIGALRATGSEIQNFWVLEEMLTDLAQVPFGWHPPDGYPDVAAAWINSGGLLARWNTAMRLTHGGYSDKDSGVVNNLHERIGTPATVGELVDAVALQVFAAPLPERTRAQFIAYASGGNGPDIPVTAHLLSQKLGTLFGLMLASPQYQWR